MLRIPSNLKSSFGFTPLASKGRRRDVRFTRSLEWLEERTLLTIAFQDMSLQALSYVGNSVDVPPTYTNNITQNSAGQIAPISVPPKNGYASKTVSGKPITSSYTFAASSTIQNSNSTSGAFSLSGSVTTSPHPVTPFGYAYVAQTETYQIKSQTASVVTFTYNLTSSLSDQQGNYTNNYLYIYDANKTTGAITLVGNVTSGKGTITLNLTAAQMSSYGVYVTAEIYDVAQPYSGRGQSSTITESSSCNVSWKLTPAPPPLATIAINNTAATNDNITLFNPTSTGEGATQTIPATITNISNTTQTFQLSVNRTNNGAPYATLDKTSVTLAPKAWKVVTITPKADSSAPNDVQIVASVGSTPVGEDDMTIVRVTFGTTRGTNSLDIRNADTPATMKQDRIPPTSDPKVSTAITPVYVTITPNLGTSGEFVTLAVDGQDNPRAGTVTFAGKSMLTLTSSSVVNLYGGTQTVATGSWDPKTGNGVGVGANKNTLKLAVIVDTTNALESNGFSVAAIPVDIVTTYLQLVDATHLSPPGTNPSPEDRGIFVVFQWSSDSGVSSDLSAVDISEQVQYTDSPNGVFTGITHTPSGYLTAVLAPKSARGDKHTVFASDIRAQGGTEIVDQTFTFRDLRTGVNNIVIPDAGYVIMRTVFPTNSGWMMTTTEVGQTTTANTFKSNAGVLLKGNKNNGLEISVTQGP